MSPQAAAVSSSSSTAAQSHRVSLVESDNCSFLSSLIEAADEAYQKTSDGFAPRPPSSAQVHAGPGRTTHAPGGGGGRPRFHLRKRKASVRAGASCGGPSLSAVNSAFLSGLFADLEQQQQRTAASSAAASSSRRGAYDLDDEEHYVTDGESCPGSPVPSPKKRARLGRSLSRCTKSYASLAALASATYSSTDSYVEGENFSDRQPTDRNIRAAGEPAANHDEPAAAAAAPPTVSAATSTASASSAVAPDVLADSLSAAAALLADAIFPHLPATVSESPLRKSSSKTSASSEHSADLTAQLSSSTEAATEAGANAFHVEPEQGQEPEKELTLEEVFATPPTEGGPASSASASASAAVTPTDEDGLLGASGRGEDSYGWFLALDRDVDASEEHVTDAYRASAAALAAGRDSSSSSCGSAALAFQAPVSAAAGCAAHDAEVEWAKAADTVDDVLGDLPF